MKLNAVDWGKLFGGAVDSYGDYKVASEQRKALEAQLKAAKDAEERAYQNYPTLTAARNYVSTTAGNFGIPTEYLMIGGALLLVLLITGGNRK